MLELTPFHVVGIVGLSVTLTVGAIAGLAELEERRRKKAETCGDGGNHHYGEGEPKYKYKISSPHVPYCQKSEFYPKGLVEYTCQHEGCFHAETRWQYLAGKAYDSREAALEALGEHLQEVKES